MCRLQIHRLQTLLASSETMGRKYDDPSGAGAPAWASRSAPSSMAAAGRAPPTAEQGQAHTRLLPVGRLPRFHGVAAGVLTTALC